MVIVVVEILDFGLENGGLMAVDSVSAPKVRTAAGRTCQFSNLKFETVVVVIVVVEILDFGPENGGLMAVSFQHVITYPQPV